MHDVGRQRLALATPGRRATHEPMLGKPGIDAAGEQLVLRRGVDDHVAVARADDGDVVDALRRVREQVGDLDAALAVLLERPLRAEQLGVAAG